MGNLHKMKRLWAPKQEDDPTPPAASALTPRAPGRADAVGTGGGNAAEAAAAGQTQPVYQPFTEISVLSPRLRRLRARPATYSEAKPVDLRASRYIAGAALAPRRLVIEIPQVAAAASVEASPVADAAGALLPVPSAAAPVRTLTPREALLKAARLGGAEGDPELRAEAAAVVSIDRGRTAPELEDDLWSAPAEPLPPIGEATEATAAKASEADEAAKPGVRPLQFAKAGADDAGSEAFADFGIPPRTEKPQRVRRHSRSLQAFERVLLSRKFTQALVASIVLVFVSNLDVPWRDWAAQRLQQVREPIARAMDTMGRPVRERAAFFVVDDFGGGVEQWATGNGSIRAYDDGTMSVRGLALREDTMSRTSYRVDFDAKIQNRAVGWVVRANSEDTYYALKLVRSSAGHFLERYPVLDGKRLGGSDYKQISLPQQLASTSDFINVSSRVSGHQITTLVNGWGVDFWRDDRLESGGVGFLAEGREASLVRDLRISGNEDTWGLILYGTLETMRSIEDVFATSTPATIVIAPIPQDLLARWTAHQAATQPQP